jgi:predicted amidohydrolase YtcJ
LGSDWPVASPNPLLNLHAAINRAGFNEQPDPHFKPDEALPPHLAVRAASYGWAVGAGMTGIRGSLSPGKSADMTIVAGVSDDMRDWSQARVVMTICRGKIELES